ncbi:MAG: polysaccharide biosynthesis protein [Clostridia bacterium]|jgi:FlaA1/EpsC-like NDP-sugar epimerase|nr:polysaccharide biosynthesis protein [Clostridia bacterium]
MKRKKEKAKHASNKLRSVITVIVLDVIFAFGSYWAARAIMFYRAPVPEGYTSFEWLAMLAMVIITISMLVFFDCYNSVWKYAGRVEFFKFILAYFTSFGIIMLFKVIMNVAFDFQLWSPLALMYLLFSAICSGVTRFINGIMNYIVYVRRLVGGKADYAARRTVVIGAGYMGSLIINRFINNPQDGYFPVAFIDDDPDKQDKKIYGIKVEGGMDRLGETVAKYRAQAIVIAIMKLSKTQLRSIYERCSKFNVPIKVMPEMTNASDMSKQTLSLRDLKIEELLGRDEFRVCDELMNSAVKDKVVMVTGGAGSIGSELCRQALRYGCRHLVVFDMHENGMFFLNEEFKSQFAGRYSLVIGTVRERDKLRETLGLYNPEIVFHAAAYKHVPMMEIAPTEAIKNNVFGTLNTIEECENAGVKRFVLVSTDKAVNPANVMGASKRLAEMLIQTRGKVFNMQMAAVRFGNVLGSNGSVIPIFLKQIKEGGPITLTDRNIKRYFMTIPEAVRLVMQTAALASGGEVFVLDMGEPVYIYDLACDLIRINGLIPEQDIPIKVTGLRPGEKLFEELRYDKETVDKTMHEGIFVTRLEKIDGKTFDVQLEKLRKAAFKEDERVTEKTIFEIVPSDFRDKVAAELLATQNAEIAARTSHRDEQNAESVEKLAVTVK